MKKKTFFATLLLFLVFFNGTILIISFLSLRSSYAAVRERCLAEHFVIATALTNDIRAVESRWGNAAEIIGDIMSPYTRYSQNKTMSLSVSSEGAWIWNASGHDWESIPQRVKDLAAAVIDDGTGRTIFTQRSYPEGGGVTDTLYIYGRLPSPCNKYGLLYAYDLSEMMDSWRASKNMLFLAGFIATVILACCLLYLLNILFRPLRQIAAASRDIASGHYEKRLQTTGNDEMTAMTESFNRMAQEIETRIAQLEDAAAQKQRFIDNFAHELRTPLTAVYGYAEYLQKASVTEEDKYTSTQFIMSECNRLQNMAEQLLELAAIRNERLPDGTAQNAIPSETFPASELFGASRRAMQVKAGQRNVSLRYDCTLDTLTGSRNLLESLLNNLVDNAVKASPEGSVIHISGFYRDGRPVLSVKDSGIGMTGEQLSHITEAFYRADKARSRASGGAGLGLSICRQIAALHGAELIFSSALGEGTLAEVIFTTL